MNLQGMIWLLSGEVDEQRGLRHYMVKQLLKLLKSIPGVRCRCLLMRMINAVGWSVMRCEKFVLSRKFNIKIQSLFQRCTATCHQIPSCRACVTPWTSWWYHFRCCRLGMTRIQLCNTSTSCIFMCPPVHVLKAPCMQMLRLTTPHIGNFSISS